MLDRELVGTIGRFDRHTHTLTTAEIDKNLYPTEPIHVVDKFDSTQGWILTIEPIWDLLGDSEALPWQVE